jgi:hypothetical protein
LTCRYSDIYTPGTTGGDNVPQEKQEPEFQKISCKIPRALWRQGKIRAMDENVEFQEIVTRALQLYLKGPEKRGKGER